MGKQKRINPNKINNPKHKGHQPGLEYSIHDLDKQKTLVVTRAKLQAEFDPWIRANYTKYVSDLLVKMYKRHAKHNGDLNKYKGHDGTPGYRNPNYLWDHLTFNADGSIKPTIVESTEEVVEVAQENAQ